MMKPQGPHSRRAKQYQKYVAQKAPKSPIWGNCLRAFLVGGAICTLGQGLLQLYAKVFALPQDSAAAWVSITLVFLGALFTGLGLYDDLGKFAGAGSIVPITGFANSVASPAVEFKQEGFVLGVGAKMFTIAGPVIVYGTIASVVCGVVYWVYTLV